MTYGPIPGVPSGARFRNRRALYMAGVHRDIQGGIGGGTDSMRGVESVVLSGGYEDDLDLGQIVYYTGTGKRDRSGHLTADQEFTGKNRSLAKNVESSQPVRLIRAISGEFEYSGLYIVEDAFLRPGASGYKICQYRLRALQADPAFAHQNFKPEQAKRLISTHYRLARDRGIPARVKALYDYRCQICDTRIETLAGPYAEGAHIVPLGGGAEGPDSEDNVLSLCPNHHVMLDHGAITLTDDWTVIDRDGDCVGQLKIDPTHTLRVEHARTHRKLVGLDHLAAPSTQAPRY